MGVAIEQSRIERYLRAHVWPDAGVENVETIGRGWESEIIGFTADLPSGALDLALRMYTGNGGVEKAKIEGSGMPKLHAAGYPIPRVFHSESDPEPLGFPFIIMERASGTEFSRSLKSATGATARRLEIEFIDLLVALHRVDVSRFLTEGAPTGPHHFIRRMFAQWRLIAAAVPADIETALSWFDQHIEEVEPLPPSVTHNDFHPGNILRDEGGRMTVIDWTGLAVADPRSDLAWTILLRETYGADGAAERERRRYASQLPTANLEFFEAAARLRRLFSLVVSLTAGPAALGMRSGAAEQMLLELKASSPSYSRFLDITGVRLHFYEQLVAAVAESEHGDAGDSAGG